MITNITIVTPSYNQANFLEETIESVLSQREAIHEYFLLDGGSTDGSVDLIRKYHSKIDWWVSEKDKGQSDAIHRGFTSATGDVLGWINSDDVLLPKALSRVKAVFEANSSVDIVTGYLAHIDAEGRIISMPRVPSGLNALGRRGLILINQQATFFRRSLYEKVGGLDVSLHCAMDLDLWSRFYLAGAKWHHIPVYLAAFRKHCDAKGSGNTWWDQYQVEKAHVRDRYPEIFGNQNRLRAAIMWYRVLQLISGRQLLSSIETTKYRKRSYLDIF